MLFNKVFDLVSSLLIHDLVKFLFLLVWKLLFWILYGCLFFNWTLFSWSLLFALLVDNWFIIFLTPTQGGRSTISQWLRNNLFFVLLIVYLWSSLSLNFDTNRILLLHYLLISWVMFCKVRFEYITNDDLHFYLINWLIYNF